MKLINLLNTFEIYMINLIRPIAYILVPILLQHFG